LISIICPTIDGREHHLTRCERAYCETAEDFEFIVLRNFSTCGQAWNEGLRIAEGDFLHLTADDLEPHPGWLQAALETIRKGSLPCPRILRPDGSLESCGDYAEETVDGTPSDVARIPFFPRFLLPVLYPIFDNQYMGDYWISTQARKQGWPTVVVRDYLFTHHFAQEGRLNTLEEDVRAFREATA
jgi:hypothetical protein